MAIQDEVHKSRLTMRYRTEINGAEEDATLPLRLAVMGDFSAGTSKDRAIDLDERRMRSLNGTNTDAVMKDLGTKLSFSVANRVDPENGEDLQVHIPIDSMKSFTPEAVAKQVPKLNGLLTLKGLLEEMLSNVDNRKDFRRMLNDLMADQEALAKVLEQLKDFEGVRLPKS